MFHFFAIPCKVIKKVGKIDENYFIQIEDSDYSRRITKAGFDAFQIKEKYSHPDKPSSWIYPNFVYYTIRNSLYYNEKHTRGIKKIYNEIKIRAKAGIISAFSEITNLNLQEPIVLAINDYKQKKMGRNHYNFNKIEKQEFDQYLSPKELYLSKWEENKAFYVKEIIKKMLI
jgi:GT2 family glycosyltransferase